MSSIDDYDWGYYEDAPIEEIINDALKDVSFENAKNYLGTYGDAVQSRIEFLKKEARQLYGQRFYCASIIMASIAIELILRYLLVRPLVQGAFLSEEWASILAKRIVNGRTVKDRELLPVILRQNEINLNEINLSNGEKLWDTIINKIWTKRNKIIHQGDSANDNETITSIECVDVLIEQIVLVLARKLGFSLDSTNKWSEIRKIKGDNNLIIKSQTFKPKSPFD